MVSNGNLPKKIYNGDIIPIHRRAYQVSIQLQKYHICGGAIISDNQILTSSSCVLADRSVAYGNLKILSGTNDLMTGGKIHQVAYTIFHEDYNPHDFWTNDIAILVLSSSLEFNAICRPIDLVKKFSFSNKFRLTGWGINPTTNDIIQYLQELEIVSIYPRRQCELKYYNEMILHKSQYCLLPKSEGSQITQGSGGSPIISGHQVVGVLSTVDTRPNYPAIYTLVNGNLPKKVSGGAPVSTRRRPYHVSIQLQDFHICNGIIISSKYILTAASCVVADRNKFYGNIQILSGTNDLTENGEIHKVAYTIIHEEYDPHNFWIHDIAILKLEDEINFDKICKKAKTPEYRFTNHKLQVVGWSIDLSTNNMITILQQIRIQSMTNEVCKLEFFPEQKFHKTQFCALPLVPTAHITEGNGGSPIMSGKAVVGIVSLISMKLQDPAIYTRVYHYLEWIDYMKNKIQ
ncbi:serine protease 44-like [Aphidius gifuensis]|uniref:serine protease 44-like n=1 Tax=Aphidius gifuensis TaxID=684658 RepID=UPI001CDD293C|nr:serine protease 44-like [Aphidius gifuensis]